MSLPLRSVIAAVALAAAAPVLAATAVHIESGAPGFLSFDIAQQPTPAAFVTGSSFTLNGVNGTFGGVVGTRSIEFFDNSLGGGFQVSGGPGISSQQIYYAGQEAAPFILSGDYAATDRATGAGLGLIIFQNGTIADVPEPAAWVLMIGGFGLVGVGLRRRAAVTA